MKKFIILISFIFLLTACSSANWNIKVDINQEERTKLTEDISRLNKEIENYKPNEELNTPEVPISVWINLARSYEYLGNLKMSLKTLEKAKKFYDRSQAIENNIAKLYQKAGDYQKAIEQYLYLIDEFQDSKYYYDIIKIYINKKDLENSEKYYNIYKSTGKTDSQFKQEIKKLKEAKGE